MLNGGVIRDNYIKKYTGKYDKDGKGRKWANLDNGKLKNKKITMPL